MFILITVFTRQMLGESSWSHCCVHMLIGGPTVVTLVQHGPRQRLGGQMEPLLDCDSDESWHLSWKYCTTLVFHVLRKPLLSMNITLCISLSLFLPHVFSVYGTFPFGSCLKFGYPFESSFFVVQIPRLWMISLRFGL